MPCQLTDSRREIFRFVHHAHFQDFRYGFKHVRAHRQPRVRLLPYKGLLSPISVLPPVYYFDLCPTSNATI